MADLRWQAVSLLVDPVRRSLYEHVRRQDHPVSREEAADAAGVSRALAAFHLDKLVEAGLLRARYEAPGGQPRGRGRAPKVYEPTDDGISFTMPERRYELIAEILADAVATAPDDAGHAARKLAFDQGRQIGYGYRRDRDDGQPDTLHTVLADLGFAPVGSATADVAAAGVEPGVTALRNCPFHRLALRQPDLVCRMNQVFIAGVLDGLGASGLTARLEPQPGACCVVIRGGEVSCN